MEQTAAVVEEWGREGEWGGADLGVVDWSPF